MKTQRFKEDCDENNVITLQSFINAMARVASLQ